MANNNSLREAICSNLAATLSENKTIRENAEQQLIMLETNEEHGLHLMEISLSENNDFTIRHLASVLLNRYIVKHWCQGSAAFEPPEVSPPVKMLIRDYLLKALVISGTDESTESSFRKLRNSYARAVSHIAQNDWPQQWPQLFSLLNQYLVCGQPNAVYSALKVFKELAHEITDNQIPEVAPILNPQLLEIFESKNYSVHLRTNAIKTFGIIAQTIILMDELHIDVKPTKLYLAPYIPKFMESALVILSLPFTSPDSDIALQKEIVDILGKLLRCCQSHVKIYVPKILELIWQHMTTSASHYVKHKVNYFSSCDDGILAESVDSDGETFGFERFLDTILEFVNSTFEQANYRSLIKPVLSDLLYYVLFYVQITDEQMERWRTHLDIFIEEDDIDASHFSIRIAAQDLIMNLARYMTTVNERKPKADDELFKMAFLHAIQRHFAEASQLEKAQKGQTGEPPTWWKTVESCLYAMSLLAPTIIYTIKSGKPPANEYKAILDNVLQNFNLAEPFLTGRSLWTASRFSPIMNDQSLDTFLKLTSNLLNAVDTPVLRVYALRAAYFFLENIQTNRKVMVIKPYMHQFLQGLVSFGMTGNSDTMYLVLQTIDLLLELDDDFTANVSGSICSLVLSVFVSNVGDAIIFDVILSILKRLLTNEACFMEIQVRLLPVLVAILNEQPENPHLTDLIFNSGGGGGGGGGGSNSKLPSQEQLAKLQPDSLDILTEMINRSKRLNEFMVHEAYPALIRCLNAASKEESALFQNGTECLSAFLKTGSEYLVQYVDPATNQNGIVLALNVCINMLGPQMSDSAAAYVGRVIVILIIKSNRIIGHENIQHLLRSTLVRLNTSKELLILQSLILVFAHLLYTDLPTILIFLNSLPAPYGTKSALEFVLDKWLGIQRYLHGYENKASTVALCRLFQHALQHGREGDSGAGGKTSPDNPDLSCINLHQIQVSCEDEFDDGQCHRTRSKTAAAKINSGAGTKNRTVPCTVKILKLLINELVHIKEMKIAQQNTTGSSDLDDEEDDEEEEDADDDDGHHNDYGVGGDANTKRPIIDLTDLLLNEDLGQDDIDEGEILSEEIGNLDLETVLRTFLTEFRQHPLAGDFVGHLTPQESSLLEQL